MVLHLEDQVTFFSEAIYRHGAGHVGLSIVSLERAFYVELVHLFVAYVNSVLVGLLLLLVTSDRVNHGPRTETLYLQVLEERVGTTLAVNAHQEHFLAIAGKLDFKSVVALEVGDGHLELLH